MEWRRIEFLSLRSSPFDELFFSLLQVQMQGSLVVLLSVITAVVVVFHFVASILWMSWMIYRAMVHVPGVAHGTAGRFLELG